MLSLDEVGRGTHVPPPLARKPRRASRAVIRAGRGAVRWVKDSGTGNSDHREFALAGLPAAKLGVPDDPLPPHERRQAVAAPAARVRQCARSSSGSYAEQVPEGDTIHYAANRIRPVLEGHVPDELATPHPRFARDRWPERLAGQAVRSVDAHGKHLFLRFEGGLTIHSHLRMTGSWRVLDADRWRRSPRAPGSCMRRDGHEVVQFNGPVLELMTDSRTRFDQRIAGLGPDILAPEFDYERFLRRLREDDPTRPIGDAVLQQRTVAGIGNLWKAEACFEAGIDPWRPHRRGQRRRGGRDRRRRPPAHAGVRRAAATRRNQQRLQPRRAPVPALRHARSRARPVGRQPHDLLVPGMSALRRVGHKGADLIAPGNTRESFDAALEAGVDMIEFDVLPARWPAEDDTPLILAHDYEHAAGADDARRGPRPPRLRRRSPTSSSTSTSSSPATRSRWWRRCASTTSSSARSSRRSTCAAS